jgi:hypothetical protein
MQLPRLERSKNVTRIHPKRDLPWAVAFVLALVSAAVIGAVTTRSADAQPSVHAHAHKPHAISARELAFRNEMRRLWEDHVTWTRLAIISLTSGSPDTQATVARLLKNQDDIGAAVGRIYGRAAGRALARLLREHITIAADLVAAAKAGDQAGAAAAQQRWVANADQIAVFLNRANPRAWKLAEMKKMLHEHLDLTGAEAVARLRHEWTADVRLYDQIHRQALHMADMLSTGIVRQFPRRFR